MTRPFARTRTRTEDTVSGEVERTGYAPGVLGTYPVSELFESMDDVVTPGYHKKIAQGHVINNSCLYTKAELYSEGNGSKFSGLTSGTSKDNMVTGPITRYYIGDAVSVSDLLDPSPSGSAQAAKNAALANVDSTPYSFGEDIGEIYQTLQFVKNPLKSILKLGKSMQRDVKKGLRSKNRPDPRTRKQRAQKALYRAQEVADIYLSYRFAFKPLVRSAYDAFEYYSTEISEPPQRRTSRGKSFWQHRDQAIGETGPAGSIDEYLKEYSIEKTWRATILYEVSNPSAKWKRDLGLRGKDLPHTLWQLLPFSFMVDRVVDISSAVSGLTNLADPNVKILAGSISVKKDELIKHQFIARTTSGWHHTVQGEKRVHREFVYKRDPYRPSIVDTIPVLTPRGLVDSATDIADLTALILKTLR